MANSRYSYDDFDRMAGMFGSQVSDADRAYARSNPDAGVALLDFFAEYNQAMSRGDDAAASSAMSGIDGIRANYAPASLPVGGGYNAKDVTGTMKALAGTGGPGVDATGDGRINARDVTSMMRAIVSDETARVGSAPGTGAPASSAVPGSAADRGAPAADPAVTPESSPSPEAEAWVNPYAEDYASYLQRVLSGKVDVESSPLWDSLRDQTLRESDRAVRDLLGKMVAANGGRASSGAASAAAQMQNYYLSQLGDRYLDVYDRLSDEQLRQLALLSDAEKEAYLRHYQEGRDAIEDEWRAKEFARLLGRDERSDFENDRAWEHNLTREKIADAYAAAQYMDYTGLQALGVDVSRYLADLDYQKQVDAAMKAASLNDYSLFDTLFGTSIGATAAAEKERTEQLERAKMLYELTGDTSGLAAYYGIPQAQIDAYLAQQAYLAAAKSSGGGSGGDSTTNTKEPTATYDKLDSVYQKKIDGLVASGSIDGLRDYLGRLVDLEIISDKTASALLESLWDEVEANHKALNAPYRYNTTTVRTPEEK